MIVDQKRTTTIRQVKQSLAKDSSPQNKLVAAKTLKASNVNLAQYNAVVKQDIVKEQAQKQRLSKFNDRQQQSGLGIG